MSEMDNNNSWNEYSKLVLKELERLNSNVESLNLKIDTIKSDIQNEISNIKTEISLIKQSKEEILTIKKWQKEYDDAAILKSLSEIKDWKKEMENIASTRQLDEHIKTINNLEKFKTKSMAIFITIQTVIGIIWALLSYFK